MQHALSSELRHRLTLEHPCQNRFLKLPFVVVKDRSLTRILPKCSRNVIWSLCRFCGNRTMVMGYYTVAA